MGDAKVVAIGEAAHFVPEFWKMRKLRHVVESADAPLLPLDSHAQSARRVSRESLRQSRSPWSR